MALTLRSERAFLSLRIALRQSLYNFGCCGLRNEDLFCCATGYIVRPDLSIEAAVRKRPHRSFVTASQCSTASHRTSDQVAAYASLTVASTISTQAVFTSNTNTQDKKVALELLSSLRQSLPAKGIVLKDLFQSAASHTDTAQDSSKHSAHRPWSRSPRPRLTTRKQTVSSGHIDASQNITAAVDNIRQLQLGQEPSARVQPASTTNSTSELHVQLGAVLAEAQIQPHWNNNADGFHACLDNVELLFRQLFFQSDNKNASNWAVEPTHSNLSQCINTVLPVLLIPQQSPAPNIAGVTEFLHDMLQLSGKAIFHCMCQEPAILYLDVYNDLLPMQDYLDSLQWHPAAYKHIIVRHPQLLLLPLPQLKRNLGYLLGQGLSRQNILDMWKQRAGLMVESLRTLHGQLLGLRQAGRPLQDLALPAALRPAPVYGPVPHPSGREQALQAMPGQQAVSAVVGDPQAVYLYNMQRYRSRHFKGISQTVEGRFLAKAHVGGPRATKIGEFATINEAARAYDAAVFAYTGKSAKLNFPDEYAHKM